jgi:hypothetical protein
VTSGHAATPGCGGKLGGDSKSCADANPARTHKEWIAANGKDAINATGIGAFFNLMNFGQMLLWHVVLIPIILISLAGAPPVTVRSWVQVAPADFLAAATSELNGTSLTATYGPPYNTNGTPQSEWFAPANWAGVRQQIDAAQTFVLEPLSKSAPTDPQLAAALATYNAASPAQQDKWATSYGNAVTKVTFSGGTPVVPTADDGPVPVMLAAELTLARTGAVDVALAGQQPFYGTDFTKPLLFLEDGQYYANQATAMNLTGDQWGVMNETGSYPGQPWLWLYQLWYHVPGWRNSANVDLIAIYMTGLATLLLLLIPFIPGLRDIPRLIPVHRLIWHTPPAPAHAADRKPAGAALGRPPGRAGAGLTVPKGPSATAPARTTPSSRPGRAAMRSTMTTARATASAAQNAPAGRSAWCPRKPGPAARQSPECQDGTAPGIPGGYRSGSPDAAASDTGRDDPHE